MMKKKIKRSTDDLEDDKKTLVTTALNVKWSAFEDERTQQTVTRYELQYRYSARAKWVRVRRGLDVDSRSYVVFSSLEYVSLLTHHKHHSNINGQVRDTIERCSTTVNQ